MFENHIRVKGKEVKVKVIDKTLTYFKTSRLFLLITGSIESSVSSLWNTHLLLSGLTLFFFGMLLRYLAIRELGPQWSFHVVEFKNHRVIKSGIYKYLDHPAYFGNIYLPGILISIGSLISASVAILVVLVFYIKRSQRENQILKNLGNSSD